MNVFSPKLANDYKNGYFVRTIRNLTQRWREVFFSPEIPPVQDALMPDLSDRLDRIDTKLDKLSEAVSQLARIEERISHQNENMGTIDARLNDMETRIRTLEQASNSRGVILAGIERFGWIVISAMIGLAAYFVRK
ncbi:hypothetical protein [Endozoicomonas atrinae]|uniref:hypothetical protein n=1 Tax=Endozoicomonas atrinae TaxID=1333660 RepID=UPI003B005477